MKSIQNQQQGNLVQQLREPFQIHPFHTSIPGALNGSPSSQEPGISALPALPDLPMSPAKPGLRNPDMEGTTNDEPDPFEEWIHFLASLESAPVLPLSRQLIEDGIPLPPPDALSAAEVSSKLWEVIRGMARHRHYLENTDHLSDLELYRVLWERILDEETCVPGAGAGAGADAERDGGCLAFYIDLIDDCSPETNRIYLQYYADDLDREFWEDDYPEGLPPKLELPHDRDRLLPRHHDR